MLAFFRKNIVLFLLLLFHVILQWKHLNLDFWNDEIASLQKFVFQPIETTLFDYHDTNNHIFFNLINKIYLGICGIKSLHELMDAPWIIRLLPLVYSIVTLTVLYRIGTRNFGKFAGIAVLVVWICSIPYYNFALQLRGYGLSMMLVSILLNLLILTRQRATTKRLISLLLVSGLLFYTIPLNLLFLASVILIMTICLIWNLIRARSFGILFKIPESKIMLAIFAGIILCLLLYIPMFDDVFFNRHVISKRSIWNPNLAVFNVTILSFISKQYVIVALVLIGWLKAFGKHRFYVLLFAGLVLMPFVLAYGMGMAVFERIFVNLMVPYALGVGLCVSTIFEWLVEKKKRVVYVIALLVLAQMLYVFNTQQKRIRDYLVWEEVRGQGLYYNYFLKFYEPKAEVERFLKYEPQYQHEILVFNCEPYGFHNYLEWAGLKYRIISDLRVIHQLDWDKIYIATTRPGMVEKLCDKSGNCKVTRLNDHLMYQNIVRVERLSK